MLLSDAADEKSQAELGAKLSASTGSACGIFCEAKRPGAEAVMDSATQAMHLTALPH